MTVNKEAMMKYLNTMQSEIAQKYKDDPNKYHFAEGFKACMNYIDLLCEVELITKE